MGAILRTGREPWLVMLLAFSMAPIAYYVIGESVSDTSSPADSLPVLRSVFAALALALAQLAVGAFFMTRAPRAQDAAAGLTAYFGGGDLASPRAFLAAFLVAAALAESAAVLGFVLLFLGAAPAEYLPFGAGTLAVMLGVGLPTGLRYWNEREAADAGGVPPIG